MQWKYACALYAERADVFDIVFNFFLIFPSRQVEWFGGHLPLPAQA